MVFLPSDCSFDSSMGKKNRILAADSIFARAVEKPGVGEGIPRLPVNP